MTGLTEMSPGFLLVLMRVLGSLLSFPKEHLEWKLDRKELETSSRRYLADKVPSSQSSGFSSGHVWVWELDYKEN